MQAIITNHNQNRKQLIIAGMYRITLKSILAQSLLISIRIKAIPDAPVNALTIYDPPHTDICITSVQWEKHLSHNKPCKASDSPYMIFFSIINLLKSFWVRPVICIFQ